MDYWKEFSFVRSGATVSHLQFVDDTIFFQECLKELETFEIISVWLYF